MAKRKSIDTLDLTVRTSQLNKNWDEAVGKALDVLPLSTLPTQRNVLQRYRCIRTEDPEGNYKLPIYISKFCIVVDYYVLVTVLKNQVKFL